MIQRVVLVKLKRAYADDRTREQIAAETRRVLVGAHGVRHLEVGFPADGRSRAAWDLCILVRFASREDVEAYRTDKVHRAYADVFLKPMRERIEVWNFDVGDEGEVAGAN
jgi:hypothetical protein